MARLPRRRSYSNIYHIMIRGINKQKIFFDNMDYGYFLKVLKKNKEKYGFSLLAFCLMPNHVHIMGLDRENKLSEMMKVVEITYAFYFNKKYDRVGYVFQSRFKSKGINDPEYFESVIKYIHQNPEKAGIETIEKYKWSSYRFYLNYSDFVDYYKCFELLEYNNLSLQKSMKKFVDFNTRKTYNYEKETDIEFEQFLTNDEAYEVMENEIHRDGIDDISAMETALRNQYIRKFKKIKCINNGQIADFFNLSRRSITNIGR